jgi:hypothetical protein
MRGKTFSFPADRFLLRYQPVEAGQKAFRRLVAVVHCRRGSGVSNKAVST